MKQILAISLAALLGLAGCRKADEPQIQARDANQPNSLYNIAVVTIDGDTTLLNKYQGKVLLIVNVASRCGFTSQYEGLQKLYETYADSGLVILGFPANNFRNQEPGSDAEILAFCSTNYGVTFPMFSKISVVGEDMHPLYRYLTGEETNPQHGGAIPWNFTKFLIDRQGRVVARFNPAISPSSDGVMQAVRSAL
ncbi:glutathione peroxidase [candidate division KSB1 bacterium]|nr:glutathione peroxidase [candidate division KSB1 bacterium]